MSKDTTLAELMDLTGTTAIVTGAAVGIGAAIATRLAEAGSHVVIADRDLQAAELLAKTLGERPTGASAVEVDVADENSVHEMVESTVRQRGSVDILVNNAGIYPNAPVLSMSAAEFDRVVDVNLRGVFLCCRRAAQQMVAQGRGGRIINITSVDAIHPSGVGLAHYDASKHGVWGFTKNLALELAPHRIWVNAIAPGGIASPGTAAVMGDNTTGFNDLATAFQAGIPMQRLGDPDDIGRVAVFLASDVASYVTGSQLVVDGGSLLT